MSSSHTPTYRVEYSSVVDITRGQRVGMTPCAWRRPDGRPTAANLERHVRGFEESTLPGGVNAHCGITRVGSARLVRQADGEVMATYAPPMFEAV